jgi:hypothetical protein
MERQIPALLKPKVREAELTITNSKTKHAYIALVDWERIGIKDITLRCSGVTRDTIKVKVSRT